MSRTPDRLRAAIDQSIDRVPLVIRDLEGRILLWTGADEALFGWSAQAARGCDADALLQARYPLPWADFDSALRDQGEWRGELACRHRDGRELDVLSHFVLHRRADGTPQTVSQVCQDVADLRRSQSMIEEREGRLRSILEAAPDAIITIDEHGIVQSFSQAAETMFGYAAGEVVGQNVAMLMGSPHAAAHDGYLARYLRTGEKRIIGIGRQVEARRKDGAIFPIELAVGEVRLRRGWIFTGFIRDVSARTRMEAELRQAQRMEAIGQLTGGVSHDFNNLLTVIAGNLEMLQARLRRPDDLDLLREAQEATALGAQLASRLLAFGRRQPLLPAPVDLDALVDGLTGMLQRTLGEAVTVERRLAGSLPSTMVDRGQVETALLNLAINARDAMPGGGRLVIETGVTEVAAALSGHGLDAPAGRYVTLAVSDTGVGMAPEVLERAFDPFFTTKEAGLGSGLGLSMVYGFVKQSGGHVQLRSEPGRGTAVTLYLPAFSTDTETAPPPPAAPGTASGRGRTVLVVEDNAQVRRITVRRLHELGYAVIEADGGDAGLAVLRGGRPVDVLFTDLVMPGGLDGAELAAQARQLHPGIKVLLTSGYADPATLDAVTAIPGAGWLAKPYGIDTLREKLGGIIDA